MGNVKAPVWLALVGTIAMVVLLGVQTATSDGSTTDGQEIVQIMIGAVTVFAVWAAANLPGYTWIKTAIAAVLALLNVLVTVILGGVGTGEIINMVIAVLVALGIPMVTTPITTVIDGRTKTFEKGRVPAVR
jgi:hypothetical protein